MCRITMANATRHHIKSKQLHNHIKCNIKTRPRKGAVLMDIGVVGRGGRGSGCVGEFMAPCVSWRGGARGDLRGGDQKAP